MRHSLVARFGKNFIITISAPILVYLFFYTLCHATGHAGFGVGSDFRTILLNMVYSGLISLAVSYNLTSGRFDFSVGSVLILSVIAGGTLAKTWNGGAFEMLLLILAFGLICGLVSGLVYIALRLPPMVTSLGMAMIYEAIAFKLNDSNGIRLTSKFNMLIWAQPPYHLLLLAGVLLILIYLLNFTAFGYNCRSLQHGQKNAVDVGINEKRNAVICYIIAGGLMGCAGAVYISQYGYIAPQTGLNSVSFIMSAFLPMFIGGALAKYSDRNIGVIMGAFVQACISSGLVNMGVSSSLKAVIDGMVVLVFLVYVSNSYKLTLKKLFSQKKARALAEQSSGF